MFLNKLEVRLRVAKLEASLLTDIPPFRDLSIEQMGTMLGTATARRFSSGSAIFEEGGEAASFYLLLDGHVRVAKVTEDGEQVIMRYIASGQLLGIAAALGLTHYPATAMAADECLTLCWPTSLWQGFISDYPTFATNTYKIVGARLQDTNAHLVELATQQVERRVARAVMRLLEQAGKETDDGVLIDVPVTRQDLSEMTGTTLHTVSRLLSAWGKDGIVKSARRQITVTQPAKLAQIAEGAI